MSNAIYDCGECPRGGCASGCVKANLRAIEFSLYEHLCHQRTWSERTFGPGDRTYGVVHHITKELHEVIAAEGKPEQLEEWIDVAILALDGAWRAGFTPEQIIGALVAKQAKNENRQWPDWRTAEPGKAIEHVREGVGADEEESE